MLLVIGLGISGIIIGLFGHYGFGNIFYFSGFLLLLSGAYLIWPKDISISDSSVVASVTEKQKTSPHHEGKKVVYIV